MDALVHYDPLPHLTPAYRADGWDFGALPVAEALPIALALALPKFRRYDGRKGLARKEAEEAERAALVASSA